MSDFSLDLPDTATWISAGALLILLTVAVGLYPPYRRRRRERKLRREDYEQLVKGRARLGVIWLLDDLLSVSNSGPEQAHNLELEITAVDGESIPLLIQPEPIEVLRVGVTIPVKLRFGRRVEDTVPPVASSNIDIIDHSVRQRLQGNIMVHFWWTDTKGDQYETKLLTRQ